MNRQWETPIKPQASNLSVRSQGMNLDPSYLVNMKALEIAASGILLKL